MTSRSASIARWRSDAKSPETRRQPSSGTDSLPRYIVSTCCCDVDVQTYRLHYDINKSITLRIDTTDTQRGSFTVVRTRTRLVDGAFTVAGPAAWNSLPAAEIRTATSRTMFYAILKLSFVINTSCKYPSSGRSSTPACGARCSPLGACGASPRYWSCNSTVFRNRSLGVALRVFRTSVSPARIHE